MADKDPLRWKNVASLPANVALHIWAVQPRAMWRYLKEATRRVEITNHVSICLAAAGKRPHQKEGIGYGE